MLVVVAGEQVPLIAAIWMGTEGEKMVRLLLDAKADVNLEARVISMSTSRVFSNTPELADLCSMTWKLPVWYKKNH